MSYIKLTLICLLTTSTAFPKPLDKTLFPTPEVLNPNVEFWKKVYAVYSEKEVVIHDAQNL